MTDYGNRLTGRQSVSIVSLNILNNMYDFPPGLDLLQNEKNKTYTYLMVKTRAVYDI